MRRHEEEAGKAVVMSGREEGQSHIFFLSFFFFLTFYRHKHKAVSLSFTVGKERSPTQTDAVLRNVACMLRERRGKTPDNAESFSFTTLTDHALTATGLRKEMSV